MELIKIAINMGNFIENTANAEHAMFLKLSSCEIFAKEALRIRKELPDLITSNKKDEENELNYFLGAIEKHSSKSLESVMRYLKNNDEVKRRLKELSYKERMINDGFK